MFIFKLIFLRLFSGRPGVGERSFSGLDHGNRDEGLRREDVVLRDRGSGDSRDQDIARSRLATSSKSRYSNWSQRPHAFGDNRIRYVLTFMKIEKITGLMDPRNFIDFNVTEAGSSTYIHLAKQRKFAFEIIVKIVFKHLKQ